jgi:ribosomal protein S18 acetylase RimI-like enzyme
MNISVNVIRNGDLSSAQQNELDQLLDAVFAGQDEGLQWAVTDWNVLVYVDDVLVSNVEILTRIVTVDGKPQRIGGIGGVATHPEYRRHGYASQAMRRAESFMRDDLALEFALLVCSHERVSLYASLGWQVVSGPMCFDQPEGKRIFDDVVMILSLTGKPWPAGEIDLVGLPW